MTELADVIAALQREEPFNDHEAFDDIEPYVSFIPEIIDQLNYEHTLVTVAGVYEITIDLLAYMIECGYCSAMPVAHAALENLLENLQEDADDLPNLMGQSDMSEEDVFLGGDSQLNEEAKSLYREGKLTYDLLAVTCPRIYFQYESAG